MPRCAQLQAANAAILIPSGLALIDLSRRELALSRFRQRRMAPTQHPFRNVPAQAGVGHRHSIPQPSRITRKWLITFIQIAFQHYSDQRTRPTDTLLDHTAPNIFLPRVLLPGIGVTAINHRSEE